MFNKVTGQKGEELACNYLVKLGYNVVARNVNIAGGELDIIAIDGSYIVFVEVKTRATNKFGSAIEAVTPAKAKQIIKCARAYIARKSLYGRDIRFDVIGVTGTDIEHVENAFWAN